MSTDEPRIKGVRARAEVLDQLEDAMEECHRKVMSGRMEDPERERARQGWHQTFAKLANAYRLLSKDQDLDMLIEQVEEIETRRRGPSAGPGQSENPFEEFR
jgi:hypothetical protein